MSDAIVRDDIVKVAKMHFKDHEKYGVVFENGYAYGKVTCVSPSGITIAINTFVTGKFYPMTFQPDQVEKVNL